MAGLMELGRGAGHATHTASSKHRGSPHCKTSPTPARPGPGSLGDQPESSRPSPYSLPCPHPTTGPRRFRRAGVGPPLSQGLGNASPPPAIILLPGDRPRKKRNRAGLVSRQRDLSPPSLDIIGTQIVRHRELIARIKEEVVCGASWGHSCSERAVHYLLWGCVRASPGRAQRGFHPRGRPSSIGDWR